MLKLQKITSQTLSFNGLRASDWLIIKTENSQYQFKLTDPTNHSGVLSGGRLGNKLCRAMLLFTTKGGFETVDNKSIKTNEKAVFLVEVNHLTTHLCTSPIINLQLVRKVDAWEKHFEVA